MPKMNDLGYKNEAPEVATAGPIGDKEKEKVNYPTLHLERNVPDELMDKEVGHECRLEIVVKVVEKGVQQYGEKDRKHMALEVKKIGYIAKSGKMGKEEYMKMTPEQREEQDRKDIGSDADENGE